MTTEPAAEQPATDSILRQLLEGNRRFVTGNTIFAHESANWRQQLVGGQHPCATIVGCSDSRVPIELVFDQGFGDLFVIRVAGNVMAPSVVGSLEYAVLHLRTPLVLVLGHEGCGAVTAALEKLGGESHEPVGLDSLLALITNGLRRYPLPQQPPAERLRAAVAANVRWSIEQIIGIPELQPALQSGSVRVVGAIYDLKSGAVRLLDAPTETKNSAVTV
ncbi:MAG: carbonic anhydrase [Pirellulales bacterium]